MTMNRNEIEIGLFEAILSRANNSQTLADIAIEHHNKDYEGRGTGLVKQLIEYINKNKANQSTLSVPESETPLPPEDYFLKGLDHFFKGEYKKALPPFELALRKDSPVEDSMILNKIGACHIKLGNFDEADKILTQSIEANEKYPTGYYNFGILAKKQREELLSKGKYREANKRLGFAINLFELAIEKVDKINEDNKDDKKTNNKYEAVYSHNNIATSYKDIYLYNGDEKSLLRAIERLESLIKRNPNVEDHGLTYYNLACFYSLKKDYENAFRYLESSFKADIINVPDSMNDVDLYNIKTSKFEQYRTLIKKYLEEYIETIHKNVNNLLKRREIEKIKTFAIPELENNLVNRNIVNAETYHLLGNCYALLGNRKERNKYMSLYVKHMHEKLYD